MTFNWYHLKENTDKLEQGDIILQCPVLTWSSSGSIDVLTPENLKDKVRPWIADVVVMTQACDIEQGKVEDIILCPHTPLSSLKVDWESDFDRREPYPNSNSIDNQRWRNKKKTGWGNVCEQIKNGSRWNYSMIEDFTEDSFTMEKRIVDFHTVFSLPKPFLQKFIATGPKRLMLLPPYREYLSQAFARYFMRVGTPTDIRKNW